MKKIIVGLMAVSMLGGYAAAASQYPRNNWDRYRSRMSGNVVVIRNSCLAEEDTAAHLRIREYLPRPGVVAIYGCYHKGY